jgi:hypothetical protein
VTGKRGTPAIAAAIVLFACFWATALVSDLFLDAPFWYQGQSLWVDDLARSGMRWLPRSEALLVASVVVFLVPAVLAGAVGLARRRAVDPLERWFLRPDAERTAVVLAVTVAVAGAVFVARACVRGAELIDDERAYLFAARLFAHGEVGLPSPPHAFTNPMILLEPMWTSRYPPGHSLVLAPATWIGAERWVLPVLAGVLVVAVWSFARDSFGPRHGALAAVLAATSPFVWAVHGTVMPFGTATTMLAVFLAAAARGERTKQRRWMVLAGVAVGAAFVTRPFDAVAFALPFALRTAWEARRPAGRPMLAWTAVGFAAIAWLLPAHDALVMGHWWQMPYSVAGPGRIQLGFGQVLPNESLVHSPAQAIGNLVSVVARLEAWALGPLGLVLIAAGALRAATRADRLLRATLGCYVVLYALLPAPGTWDVGPTYYFATMPLLVPLAVRGASWLRDRARAIDATGVARRAASWVVVLGAVVSVVALVPMRAAHLSALSTEILAPWRAIEDADLGPAIVVVPPIEARRAAGWAHGYPYTLTTARGDRVDLIAPASDQDVRDALAVLGDRPIYTLVLDEAAYQLDHHRQFTVQRVKPPAAPPAH